MEVADTAGGADSCISLLAEDTGEEALVAAAAAALVVSAEAASEAAAQAGIGDNTREEGQVTSDE